MAKFNPNTKRSLEPLKQPKSCFRSPSSTRPGLFHITLFYADGSVMCSCEGFCLHGHCWHQDYAIAENIPDPPLQDFGHCPQIPSVADRVTKGNQGELP